MDTENGKYKLGVEGRLTAVEVKLEEIKMNHLPHIEQKIDRIMWLLITGLFGIAVDLVLKLIS
jgi:hypothetical protein